MFAQQALDLLKDRCSYLMNDQLFRVDIFCTISGRLVVNKFESFEAGFGSCHFNNQLLIQNDLTNYYSHVIKLLLD